VSQSLSITPDNAQKAVQDALGAIAGAASLAELKEVRSLHVGEKSLLSQMNATLKDLPGDEKAAAGKLMGESKAVVQQAFETREAELQAAEETARLQEEALDLTSLGSRRPTGARHPLSVLMEDMADVFVAMGWEIAEGPEVESDHYNFTALNIPADHPARDMQDTFYLQDNLLLRTHTSPVQIRHLEQTPPPVRIVAPGRVYRRDAVDATHSPVFHQVEVLAIDEGLDFSHLRGTVMAFLRAFFGDLPVRFRASYFPFTEPSAEVDVQWRGRWLEVMGCGMVDPAVLEGLGLDPDRWSGFAAGLGVERFCMVRHGIDDIRRLYTSDLRFLEQF